MTERGKFNPPQQSKNDLLPPRFETLEDVAGWLRLPIKKLVGRTVGIKNRGGTTDRSVAVCELVGFQEIPEMGWVAMVRHSYSIKRRDYGVELVPIAVDRLDMNYSQS